MAEPLKNHFGREIAERLATELQQVDPAFPRRAFLKMCHQGYEALELMPRGLHIARALHAHLPADYSRAIQILLASLGPQLERTENNGMAPFYYLPHTMFVAHFGLDHWDDSLRAQYELTQRFTAEFSIRPFLVRYPAETLARLDEWTSDPSVHVRRLVSEGTRPRLPWASRLTAFQRDPRPVLPLLEKLKDDPALYVRRSVANHLNDIGKDHPDLLCKIAARWLKNASPERTWVVQQALRSLIKQGDTNAFAVLGYSPVSPLQVESLQALPAQVRSGENVSVRILLANSSRQPASAIVDLRVYFQKARGQLSPKTFKLKTIELQSGEEIELVKSISLKEMTTRKHYPGEHRVCVLINGQETEYTTFQLQER